MTASQDPAIYLAQPQASPAAAVLVQQVGLHTGHEVPLWMLAEVAVRQQADAQWISGVDGLWKQARRRGMAAAGVLAVNVLTAIGMLLHYSWAGGAAEERAAGMERAAIERRDAIEREIQDLRLDLRELRAALRRMSGVDPGPSGDGEAPSPDKFSLTDGGNNLFTAAGFAAALSDVIRPRTCSDTCSSNLECTSHFGRVCPFCSFGSCSAARPESPLPDAGVDAPSAPPATPSP